jgi:probable HAF family extracellular repeat protein
MAKAKLVVCLLTFGIPSSALADAYTIEMLYGVPNAVNAAGQVVGFSQFPSIGGQATLWNGGSPAIDLGGTGSQASGVNNAGQVVGYNYFMGGYLPYHETLWNGGSITDLGTLGGPFSQAYGINSAGQIVGSSGQLRMRPSGAVAVSGIWGP